MELDPALILDDGTSLKEQLSEYKTNLPAEDYETVTGTLQLSISQIVITFTNFTRHCDNGQTKSFHRQILSYGRLFGSKVMFERIYLKN